MRKAIVCVLFLALATASLAQTSLISPTLGEKSPAIHAAPPADPSLIRQGGDTVLDATPIPTLPFDDTGTTVGYIDDYDEVCPYSGSTAPDVVYTFTPAAATLVDIDLFGSTYDTKLYVYDQDLNLVACNDDFYPDYVSKLEQVALAEGMQYFIVIDGWNGDAGDYVLAVIEQEPCDLECPPGGVSEGEPPLQDDQLNDFNDGCGSDNPDGFQIIDGDAYGELVLCGRSGWFLYQGSNFRDTDWFVATFGPDGVIEITADAEQQLYVFELGPQDCNTVGVVQDILVGLCAPGSMVVTGTPFATVWLWTGPVTFASPGGTTPFEFDYTLWITGLAPEVVATESVNWGEVKALFR